MYIYTENGSEFYTDSSLKGREPDFGDGLQAERLTDADGNAYRIVKIGKQYWTAENLRTLILTELLLPPACRGVPGERVDLMIAVRVPVPCTIMRMLQQQGHLPIRYLMEFCTIELLPEKWCLPDGSFQRNRISYPHYGLFWVLMPVHY